MADYIYLLENRLSSSQRGALLAVRELARLRSLTLFLVGGAVRDLTSGSPVRDLDVVIQGNALKLKKDLEKAGAVVMGESDGLQTLFVSFPGSVRMEIGSTLSLTYPKPGKPVAKPANILDDLRRRDFTANAMALSLNDGSYGLLMDPLNGVADIENRQLRLVSNYGFIEDPVRMIRAARLMARLGWTLDEKTETRYQTGKAENYIAAMSAYHRGYELEEVFYEEDPLRILRRLEAEGWMKHLAPFWTSAKVNVAELERMRDSQTQLQMQGIHPDAAAANFPMLTAKLTAKESESLKSLFPRTGFVVEIDKLEGEAKEFANLLGSKAGATASQAWKMMNAAKPEVVLWTIFSSKSAALQAKFKSFSTEWPQVRTKIPYVLMQEMRITPDLPGYEQLLETLFFELMDGKLGTPEETKAFLEPYSPPAPPPPITLRRPRAAKKEAKASKSRSRKTEVVDDADTSAIEMEVEPAKVAVPLPVAPIAETAPVHKAVKPATKVADAKPAAPTAPAVKAKVVAAKLAAPAKKAPAVVAKAKVAVAKVKAAVAAKTVAKKTPLKAVAAAKVVKPAAKSVKAKPKVPAKKAAVKVVAKAPKKSVPAKKTPAKKSVVPAKKSAAPAKKAVAKKSGKR